MRSNGFGKFMKTPISQRLTNISRQVGALSTVPTYHNTVVPFQQIVVKSLYFLSIIFGQLQSFWDQEINSLWQAKGKSTFSSKPTLLNWQISVTFFFKQFDRFSKWSHLYFEGILYPSLSQLFVNSISI